MISVSTLNLHPTPEQHTRLLHCMPGALANITRVSQRPIGWLPYLSPRQPQHPESLRARLFRLSHQFDPRASSPVGIADTRDEYRRLMNSLQSGLRRHAELSML